MRFQRNVAPLRSQVPAVPLVTVFFLLLIFLIPGTLVRTPGVRLRLPQATGLAGTDKPSVSVAMDGAGRLFFRGQLVDEATLRRHLQAAVFAEPEPPVLIVHADAAASHADLVRLTVLAREAGLREALLATMPRELGHAAEPNPPAP
jgi:biopolymer transport protein ExbD